MVRLVPYGWVATRERSIDHGKKGFPQVGRHGGGSVPAAALRAWPSAYQGGPRYFGLHPFVAAHPEAVFIKRTQVVYKLDAAAKMAEGKALARELFTLQDTPGFSVTDKVAMKPNITCGGDST